MTYDTTEEMPLPPLPEHCQQHGEAIATILANTTAMEAHLRTLNGRVGRTEDQIAALTVKQGAHDVVQVGMMRSIGALEEEGESMKTEMSEQRGRRGGVLATFERAATVIALLAASWAAISAHQSVPVPQAQHQTP